MLLCERCPFAPLHLVSSDTQRLPLSDRDLFLSWLSLTYTPAICLFIHAMQAAKAVDIGGFSIALR